MARVIILTVDGAIAGGKSTFVERVRGRLDYSVVVAREPVDQWEESGLLREMYESIAQRNREKEEGAKGGNDDGMPGMFQVYAFSTRLGVFARCYREAEAQARTEGRPVLLVTERSVYSDRAIFKHMLHADGYITELQARVYDGCFEAWEMACERCRPDLAVWLDTPPAECLKRQRVRARKDEDALFEEQDKDAVAYAEALDKRHREVFGGGQFEGAQVLKLDGCHRFHEDDDALAGMAHTINKSIQAWLTMQ